MRLCARGGSSGRDDSARDQDDSRQGAGSYSKLSRYATRSPLHLRVDERGSYTARTEYWRLRAPPTIVAPMAKGQVSKGKDNKEKLSIKEKKEKKKEKAANKKR